MDTEKTGGLTVVSSGDNASGEVITTNTQNQTVRGLSPRHVQLMAIGGSIGTGLWVSNSLHMLPQSDDTRNECFLLTPDPMTHKNERRADT